MTMKIELGRTGFSCIELMRLSGFEYVADEGYEDGSVSL
jgi:hypothetical protein